MLDGALSYFLYLYSLVYQALVPCPVPEQLPANTINRQQYLGKWYFKAAVSLREADIQKFKAMDNMLFSIEEKANDTLLGDKCMNQTWTYYINPERDDLELEGNYSTNCTHTHTHTHTHTVDL
uniref:Apolipoprotein M n=1 Tax=Seriola lalandi dorsalis TaxID=1841481 RepID=A0A3B4XDF3_SERLL